MNAKPLPEKEKQKLIGQRIAALRKSRRLTQLELAEKIATHKVTIAKWEGGKQEITSGNLQRLAKALGVEASTLLGDSEGVSRATLDPRDANRGHELIGQAVSRAGGQEPDIPKLLEDAAKIEMTQEEWAEVARWAALQIRARLSAAGGAAVVAARSGESGKQEERSSGTGQSA